VKKLEGDASLADVPKPHDLICLLRPTRRSAPLSAAQDFAAAYERSHLPVFRYIYGLTGGPREQVEDLTADTFTRAWKARHTFNGDPGDTLNDGAVIGWLLKIARRLVIDDYRRQRVRGLEEFPDLGELPDPDARPEQAALAREQYQTLWRLLQALPDEPREILILRYLLNWRVNQIADYLGKPENTVSVTIRRTLARLQQAWPQSEEENL
jgi:RNA polymerase sigma-70 factor, ECF subfamily